VIALLIACSPDPGPTDTQSPDTADAAVPPLESAARCGECHPTHYAEWQQSMHAYAAKSPVFDAMAGKAYRDTAGEIGTFCTGCHSPLGEVEGEGGALTAADRGEAGLEGISCDYCHTAVGHDSFIGNNRILSEPGAVKYGPYADAVTSSAHSSRSGDFLTSPELCGSCHDVYKFPGTQIEQAYTEYIASPAVDEGLRCQDCHMSPTPGVPSARAVGPIAVVDGDVYPDRQRSTHRFVGPDYSLIDEFPYPDDLEASAKAQAEYLTLVESLLKSSVRIASLATEDSTAGRELILVVSLESLVSGHRVPTGFTSERQLWLEVVVHDGNGDLLFTSGDTDSDGNLRDQHSHDVIAGTAELDEALVNLQSRNLAITRYYGDNGALIGSEDTRFEFETIFPFDANTIERRSLEPLEVRDIPIAIPLFGTSGPYTISVKLHYRNLPPYVLQALHLDDLIPRLNTFTLDSSELVVE
jgi:nitrate/TMAO reductase-like tetraheme cytochrome c subunit